LKSVRQIQLQNLDFMGSWLMLEPDALDGADSKYLPEKIAEHDKAEKGEEEIPDFSEAAKPTMKELYGPLADYPPQWSRLLGRDFQRILGDRF
jgi:hypothetical protein